MVKAPVNAPPVADSSRVLPVPDDSSTPPKLVPVDADTTPVPPLLEPADTKIIGLEVDGVVAVGVVTDVVGGAVVAVDAVTKLLGWVLSKLLATFGASATTTSVALVTGDAVSTTVVVLGCTATVTGAVVTATYFLHFCFHFRLKDHAHRPSSPLQVRLCRWVFPPRVQRLRWFLQAQVPWLEHFPACRLF